MLFYKNRCMVGIRQLYFSCKSVRGCSTELILCNCWKILYSHIITTSNILYSNICSFEVNHIFSGSPLAYALYFRLALCSMSVLWRQTPAWILSCHALMVGLYRCTANLRIFLLAIDQAFCDLKKNCFLYLKPVGKHQSLASLKMATWLKHQLV